MGKRLLLDCTLRDGGYINDWEFGHDNMVNIFEHVVSSGVDCIEIGYLNGSSSFNPDRSVMPDTASVQTIFGQLDRKNTMVLGMIDFETCDLKNLQPCAESFLDGIRVTFKKDRLVPAMAFCREVKALGYQVFFQLASITGYSDEELLEVSRLTNDVKPYALSIVDTYGLMEPEELKHVAGILDAGLDPDITLGFHAHNNLQLGYINTATVLALETERDLLVDGFLLPDGDRRNAEFLGVDVVMVLDGLAAQDGQVDLGLFGKVRGDVLYAGNGARVDVDALRGGTTCDKECARENKESDCFFHEFLQGK